MNNQVEITSVDIPFLQLVWLMSKIVIACVPAVVVAGIVVGLWVFGLGFIAMVVGAFFNVLP